MRALTIELVSLLKGLEESCLLFLHMSAQRKNCLPLKQNVMLPGSWSTRPLDLEQFSFFCVKITQTKKHLVRAARTGLLM